MGYFARRKARKAQEQREAAQAWKSNHYSPNSYGLDPVTAAVLYSSVASSEVDEDQSDQSDDVAVDDTVGDYVPPTPHDPSPSYESYSSTTDYSSSYDSGSSGGGGSFD